jgi:hypothetical protein
LARVLCYIQSPDKKRKELKRMDEWVHKQRLKLKESPSTEEIENVWGLLCKEENSAQCPSNTSLKRLPIKLQDDRVADATSAMNHYPDVSDLTDLSGFESEESEIENLLAAFAEIREDAFVSLQRRFRQSPEGPNSLTNKDLEDIWREREQAHKEFYVRHQNAKNRKSGSDIVLTPEELSMEKDVDAMWYRGVQNAIQQRVPPQRPMIVTSDLVSAPQLLDPVSQVSEDADDATVYYRVINSDVKSGAVLAVETRLKPGESKEYIDPLKVATLVTSGYAYKCSQAEPMDDISMTTCSNNLQTVLERGKNKRPSYQEQEKDHFMTDMRKAKRHKWSSETTLNSSENTSE